MIPALAFLLFAVAGSWKLTYTNENGLKREAKLELKQSGDQITGTISSDRGTAPLSDVRASGNEISFDMVRKGNGDEIRVTYKGTVQGDSMELKMQYGPHAVVVIKGTR